MKSLVVGILLATLASLVCPARGRCQTVNETATSGEAEEPVEEPVYDSSKPIPVGYVLEKRPNPGLRISGGVTFAVSYAYSLLFAIIERQDPEHATFSSGWLLIPVLGPFIAAATSHDNCGTIGWGNGRDYYCRHPDNNGLAVLGGIQAIGAVLVVGSYVAPRKRLVRSNVTLAPVPIGLGYGLSLSGRL